MAQKISQDINVLFSAFDVKDRQYQELSEFERYENVQKSWQALSLLSKKLDTPKPSITLNSDDFPVC